MSEEATTVFAQSPSGSINKVDIPTDSHARLRFDHAIEIGDITIIPDAEIVEVGNLVDGLKYVKAAPVEDESTKDGDTFQTGDGTNYVVVETTEPGDAFASFQPVPVTDDLSDDEILEALIAEEADDIVSSD